MSFAFVFDGLVEQRAVIVEQPHKRLSVQDSRLVSPGHFAIRNLMFRKGNQSGNVAENVRQNVLGVARLRLPPQATQRCPARRAVGRTEGKPFRNSLSFRPSKIAMSSMDVRIGVFLLTWWRSFPASP